MSIEDNKALVRRTFEEVWMQGNLARDLAQLLTGQTRNWGV